MFIVLPLLSGCGLLFVFFSRSHTSDYEVKHGTSCMGKTGYGAAPSPFYLCRSVAVQGAVAYLVSASDSSDTHSPFPVSGCHVSLLVKSPHRETKASTAASQNVEAKLLGFTLSPTLQALLYQLVVVGETGARKIKENYSCTYARRRVDAFGKKKCLHINLFGRNDKNRRVRGWWRAGRRR